MMLIAHMCSEQHSPVISGQPRPEAPIMKAEIERLKKMVENSDRVVFLGGAGVSTESGIPDFRSENGIFSAIKNYGYPPETLLSGSFFNKFPQVFFDYYKKVLLRTDTLPNPAHYALAELEKRGKLTAVITQNIDGLHQKAGSVRVLELHGSVYRNFCMKCKKAYGAEYIQASEGVPRCGCGGTVKPDVVLYEEALDPYILDEAVSEIKSADMLIVGGTSLSVWPAAGLADYYRGNRLVLINKGSTRLDDEADLVIREPIGETLGSAVLG
jgi:NAD-dependent deacetylase